MHLVRKDEAKFRGHGHEERVAVLIGRHHAHGSSKQHTVAIVELGPGIRSNPHLHKEREESYFVLEGAGKAIIGSNEVDFREGDCIFAEPGERHEFINNGIVPLRYLVMTSPVWIPEDSHS